MTSAVRTAASSYLLAARAGVVASGFICAAVYTAPAQAQGSYYPQGRYYSSNSYFNSSRLPTSRSYDRDYDTPRVDRLKAKTAELLKKAPVPPAPKGPLMVVVSIAKQSLTLYDEGMPIAHSKVSTGMAGHSTPTGVFAVIQKSRWHRSNLYSDAPMPFMQRITWSGVALHAGLLPGYPASHGCIRLPEDFAVRMWRTTQMGARVIIVQQDVTPAEIAHPVLFVRKGKPAVVPPADAPSAAIGLRPTVDAAKANAAATAMAAVKPAEATATETEKADTVHIKIAGVTSVSTASGEHGPDTANVANDQPATTQGVAKATAEATEQRVASADDKSAVVATVEPSITKPAAAEPSLESIMAQMPPPAAQAPSLVAPPAPAVVPPAPSVMAGRMLRPGPVSVFVSRKERRLYVRKGFEPLFDMPLTIRNADQAIGTHVFTALAEAPDSLAMRWNVVSVVPAPQAHTPERRAELDVKLAARDKGKKGEKEVISDASPTPQSTASAKEALDRLELPADAVMRISELMSTGASLIVTDEGLGPETGQETDFVVLTKDKEAAPKPKKHAKYID